MWKIEEYICQFQKIYCQIYASSGTKKETYLDMFYQKISKPWELKLLREYQDLEIGVDTFGGRIDYLKRELEEWCL